MFTSSTAPTGRSPVGDGPFRARHQRAQLACDLKTGRLMTYVAAKSAKTGQRRSATSAPWLPPERQTGSLRLSRTRTRSALRSARTIMCLDAGRARMSSYIAGTPYIRCDRHVTDGRPRAAIAGEIIPRLGSDSPRHRRSGRFLVALSQRGAALVAGGRRPWRSYGTTGRLVQGRSDARYRRDYSGSSRRAAGIIGQPTNLSSGPDGRAVCRDPVRRSGAGPARSSPADLDTRDGTAALGWGSALQDALPDA